MKPFSNRIVGVYMSAFVAIFRQAGRTSYRAASPEFQALAARPDYLPVVKYLEALGLLSVTWDNRCQPFRFTLTDAGICYFEKLRDARRKFLVNSILVPILVAIVTSFITVYILPTLGEKSARWLQWTPGRTEQSSSAARSADDPSGSQ